MNERSTKPRFEMGPPLEFLRRLWRLNHALERVSHRMERTLGLTAQQRFMVRCVGRFPGIAPGEVARALHLDPGTVSSTLRRLEEKGLVRRDKDPDDSRRTSLHLTARGRRFDAPTERTVESSVQRMLDATSAADISRVVTLLDRLAILLDEEAEFDEDLA
ncbi:MAG: MarR family transcriptional regulator [Polyangiaceae bacterium]